MRAGRRGAYCRARRDDGYRSRSRSGGDTTQAARSTAGSKESSSEGAREGTEARPVVVAMPSWRQRPRPGERQPDPAGTATRGGVCRRNIAAGWSVCT